VKARHEEAAARQQKATAELKAEFSNFLNLYSFGLCLMTNECLAILCLKCPTSFYVPSLLRCPTDVWPVDFFEISSKFPLPSCLSMASNQFTIYFVISCKSVGR
jgi:hypothetical protein